MRDLRILLYAMGAIIGILVAFAIGLKLFSIIVGVSF